MAKQVAVWALNKKEKDVLLKNEEEWKKKLTPEQYKILREKATEAPNSGQYNLKFDEGTYKCAGCGAPLFASNNKFKSSCGWPSFDDALSGSVEYVEDKSHGMVRTEVICANCGGHLGHIFNDGPTANGQRFCINSGALNFKPEES